MDDSRRGLSRRRFLSGLAVLGATPVWTKVASPWWQQPEATFSGDDLELAHRLLERPRARARRRAGRRVEERDFASGRHPTHAVLTVYRPYPYPAGRASLAALPYEEIERGVRREVIAGFGPYGLRAGDIEGIRLAR